MYTLKRDQFDAVILDLDGVITGTARLHAQAWKGTFDEYNRHRRASGEKPFREFEVEPDYRRYVDGKPRRDGIRSFLESRAIALPEGEQGDTLRRGTVAGLANRKNQVYLELLDKKGPTVYEDAVRQVRRWRGQGLKTAVVSSSRNCARVLDLAGVAPLFDVRVDGVTREELNLRGKPSPDIFLAAAERLGVPAVRALVVEDAVAGVRAGRRGGFGAVVGVDRTGDGELLRDAGAHWVVSDLGEIGFEGPAARGGDDAAAAPPSALDAWDVIARKLEERRVAVFLDYDGTLTPIVSRPELAVLSDSMRDVLVRLSAACPVAVVSGRDVEDVRAMVGLEGLVYAGSHGFDIAGPRGLRMEHAEAGLALPELDAAGLELGRLLSDVKGAWLERKRFSLAVHFRAVAEEDLPRVETAVTAVYGAHEALRRKGGKKVVELSPDVAWDKGAAVLWILDALDLPAAVVPVYLGDDLTDEDAFRALRGRGLGVFVGETARLTSADFSLSDVDAVRLFLDRLARMLGGAAP